MVPYRTLYVVAITTAVSAASTSPLAASPTTSAWQGAQQTPQSLRIRQIMLAVHPPMLLAISVVVGLSGVDLWPLIPMTVAYLAAGLHLFLRYGIRSLTPLGILDITGLALLVLLAPTLWPVALFGMLGVVSMMWLQGVRETVITLVLSVGLLVFIATIVEVQRPWIAIGAFGLQTLFLSFWNLLELGARSRQHAELHDLVTTLPVGTWEVDLQRCRVTRAVGRWYELIERFPHELTTMGATTFMALLGADPALLGTTLLEAEPGPLRWEHQPQRVDDRQVWLRHLAHVVRSGDRVALRGITLDVTAEVLAQSVVHQHASIVQRMNDGLVLIEPNRDRPPSVRTSNPAAAALLGERLAAPGEPAAGLVDLVWQGEEPVKEAILSGQGVARESVEILRPDGTTAWVDLEAYPLPDGCLAVQLSDVTGRKMSEDKIRHQALHDQLTGLPNRHLFADRLERAVTEAGRSGHRPGVLLLDLNSFKEVNDGLGHAYGDRLLQEVAERLRLAVRASDTLARLGGDEFAVLVTGSPELDDLEGLADHISDALGLPVELADGVSVSIGCSVGIARYPDHAADPEALLSAADVAMYEAKRSGSGPRTYQMSTGLQSEERLALLSDLADIDWEDALELWCQPVFDLETRRLVGVEALVRWRHPRFGMLLPERFLDIVEMSGSAVPFTVAVLGRAVELLAQLPDHLSVSVNCSARTMIDGALAGRLAELFERFGVAAERLVIEIDEADLGSASWQIDERLAGLRDLGVPVAIDKVGGGHLPMHRLRHLPVALIKFDRALVSRLAEDFHDALLARCYVAVANDLGLTVLAAGIEDDATLRTLLEMGVGHGQGFRMAEPMAVERLLAELAPSAVTG